MKVDESRQNSHNRKLIEEIQFLSLVISTLIIITIQLIFLQVISQLMIADLKGKAEITAIETVEFLKEPLYNLDELQAIRIGEVLLSSGRITGIVLESTASGLLINQPPVDDYSSIPPISRVIVANDITVGTITFFFSDQDITRTTNRITSIAFSILIAVIVANLLANRYVIRDRMRLPMQSIVSGIDAIAAGKYDSPIAETRYSDVNMLIRMMNDMASKILTKNSELQDANSLLESRVRERTAKLENSLRDLQQAQDLLIESEKLSALGQLSAGMAHELNTPLGAIISSNRTLTEYLDTKQRRLFEYLPSLDAGQRQLFDHVLDFGAQRCITLEFPSTNLGATREFQSILAGIGIPNHKEIADLMIDMGINDRLEELRAHLQNDKNLEIITMANDAIIARRMAEIIDVAAKKAAAVIAALRSYLAPEGSGSDQVVDICRDMENVLVLMHNMLKYGITLHCEFGAAKVLGSTDKLSQVWINLIRNAAQAMEFKGDLFLRTETRDGLVLVSVIDSGSGISPEIQDKIFDPFFTTKKQGEGMGLGLDICKRIIESHNGSIGFTSVPGKTEFLVTLPSYQGN